MSAPLGYKLWPNSRPEKRCFQPLWPFRFVTLVGSQLRACLLQPMIVRGDVASVTMASLRNGNWVERCMGIIFDWLLIDDTPVYRTILIHYTYVMDN